MELEQNGAWYRIDGIVMRRRSREEPRSDGILCMIFGLEENGIGRKRHISEGDGPFGGNVAVLDALDGVEKALGERAGTGAGLGTTGDGKVGAIVVDSLNWRDDGRSARAERL